MEVATKAEVGEPRVNIEIGLRITTEAGIKGNRGSETGVDGEEGNEGRGARELDRHGSKVGAWEA